ncbi:glycosyltransferase family 2 protein [Tuberibacillus sp. Marseille-P3662]|uniref:glycosyltransferase family 2 protein n=1 Tax=Tuberibacillus sp. Marseille-P3662 TaxID=1965358 RepID=UPI000A1CD119|nr:glycosyltransferase family 2 protein [Tuberibacillus sp. Marseille-P3662]
MHDHKISNHKLVSIILVTCNGLELTKACLSSLWQYTPQPFELIIVDNGSSDGTQAYIKSLETVMGVFNDENKGFAAACNQGLRAANGDTIVLLNNDTFVTKEWLSNLVKWLRRDPTIGIVGPRSNRILPKQRIYHMPYKSAEDIHLFADRWRDQHHSQGYEVEQLSGMCMVFRRSLLTEVGGFDEQFYPGNFEDDDLSLRTLIADYRLWVADDVYIHHYGGQSFANLPWHYNQVYKDNRTRFFQKWNLRRPMSYWKLAEQEKPFDPMKHRIDI